VKIQCFLPLFLLASVKCLEYFTEVSLHWDHTPHGQYVAPSWKFVLTSCISQIFIKEGMTLVIVGKGEEWGNRFGDLVVHWNRMHKMGPGIKSRWGRDFFFHMSSLVLGSTQLPVQWVPGLSRG
jgi:hypothetical protein